MGDRQGRPSAVNLCPFVGVHVPQSVTDRLLCRHRADTDMNQTVYELINICHQNCPLFTAPLWFSSVVSLGNVFDIVPVRPCVVQRHQVSPTVVVSALIRENISVRKRSPSDSAHPLFCHHCPFVSMLHSSFVRACDPQDAHVQVVKSCRSY